MFAKVGVAATSIRSIADGLGSHTASVFHHFPTKEHIIAEVAAGIYASEIPHFEAIRSLGLGPEVTLYKLVRDDALFAASGEGDRRRLFLLPEMRSPQLPQVRNLWERMVDIYAKVLQEGIERGCFRAVSRRITAELITTAPIVSVLSWHPERLGSPRDAGREVARFVLRGLLVRPARLGAIERKALSVHVR